MIGRLFKTKRARALDDLAASEKENNRAAVEQVTARRTRIEELVAEIAAQKKEQGT